MRYTFFVHYKLQQRLEQEGEISFSVRVRPNAAISDIKEVMSDGTLKIDLHAPAEDGKANAELIRFLAEEFLVDRLNITILSGQTNRRKVVRIIS